MAHAALAALLLLGLVLLSPAVPPLGDIDAATGFALSQGLLQIERNWTLNIILVDYNAEILNEDILLGTLPVTRTHQTDEVQITYNFAYSIHYADESYSLALRQAAIENSINGTDTGIMLNETALSIQRANPNTPIRVFDPRDGRAIDGVALEDCLMANPYVPPPGLGYNFYLLNFSSFDTADHVLEHWHDYAAQDPDTGEIQDWFRLEFDHDLNPPLKMQYAGFGGRGTIYALDPSADQWYLRWARIWWQDYIVTEYEHWTKDLEDKVSEVDLQTTEGIDSLSTYLGDYMYDIVSFLLFPSQHSPAKYVSRGELRVTVVCMDVESGISLDSLRWVTDAEMQKSHLEDLYPFIEWNVEVDFVDINDEPTWNYTFWRSAEANEEGVTEVDGGEMFGYIYDVIRPFRIPSGPDLISVFGVVFIKQNMVMYYGDGAYTGLGYNGELGGQTVIWKSWERYYRSDNVTPRNGVSSIQLHETMHAVGFGHTWVHEHYASDFSYGPMGYFADHNGTASYDKDWVQGTYLDQMEAYTWNDFLTWQSDIGLDERPETYAAEENALTYFSLARDAYNSMEWMTCYELLVKARDWSIRMMHSRYDTESPVIESWGTIPVQVGNESFIYWARISDNMAGIENVTVYVLTDEQNLISYPCDYEGNIWSCLVNGPEYEENASVWVVAWDWAMNSVRGGEFRLPMSVPFPFAQFVGGLGIAAVIPAVGIAVYLRRKRSKSDGISQKPSNTAHLD